MNYIYDILVNFNEFPYDFYDWNIDDPIEHVRKIPLLKVESKVLLELKNYEFVIPELWMEKIKNKAEVFQRNGVEHIPYAALFTDGMEVLAVEFNHQGKSIGKSRLLVEEESEVLEVADRILASSISYERLKPQTYDTLKTRKEVSIASFIEDELENLKRYHVEKLRYLHYECFNTKEENPDKIIKHIKKKLTEAWNTTYPQVYEFLKLTSIRK